MGLPDKTYRIRVSDRVSNKRANRMSGRVSDKERTGCRIKLTNQLTNTAFPGIVSTKYFFARGADWLRLLSVTDS